MNVLRNRSSKHRVVPYAIDACNSEGAATPHKELKDRMGVQEEPRKKMLERRETMKKKA